MTYDVLATGSSGNAVVINGEILIDCGVPMKKLRESGHIKSLKLVLLTHAHGDHFNPATVRALHQERPVLRWGCCEWMVPYLRKVGVLAQLICMPMKKEVLRMQEYTIFPVDLVHDVPNCGWHIWTENERLFYATDTSTLDHIEAKGYDLYLIEANHTRAEIKTRIADKLARGEFAYEARAARTHLSRERAEAWLARNAGPQSRCMFLHQHRDKEATDGD